MPPNGTLKKCRQRCSHILADPRSVNREAYLENMLQPVLKRETNERDGLFDHPAGALDWV